MGWRAPALTGIVGSTHFPTIPLLGEPELPTKTIIKRRADGKGRLTFGPDFADADYEIEFDENGDARVRRFRSIPESEAWLYENDRALDSVRAGLADARAGHLVRRDIGELISAFEFADSIPEE